MKICSVKDINKAIDSVFQKASRNALSVNLLNDSTIQVDIKRASSNTIKRPDQAIKIAQNIKSQVLDKFKQAGYNEDFIKQFSNDIVRITDYSDKGIAIVKKVVSDRLVDFIETTNEMMQTQEEAFQQIKQEETLKTMEAVREAEYQQAEALGFTREEHDYFKQAKLDFSELNQNTFSQESNSVIYDDQTSSYFDSLEDTARTYSAAPSPVQGFTDTRFDNYVKFKKNQQYRLEKKLAQIKVMKKDNANNNAVLKQLIKAEEIVKEYLEGNPAKNTRGIVQDIEQLEASKDVNRIIFSAQNDIARVKYLSNSDNAENLAEAKEIIQFYKAAADFSLSPNVENPLFHGYHIANEYNTSDIPESVKQAMKDIYTELEPVEMLINNKEQQSIMQNLNNLEQIRSNPNLVNKNTGTITYNDIFYKQDGLRDLTLGEYYFYDPGTTFLRTNGVVPQTMQIMLENAYSDAHTYTKKTVESVDALLPRVTKVLRDMGYSSKVFGKNIGVDWDLFRAKDSNGLLRDGIVQRYSNDFLEAISNMKRDFSDKVRKALDPSVDPKIRASLLENIHKERDKWLKENTLVIDPRKIAEISSQFNNGTFIDDNGAHTAELKALLGEQGYKEEIEKQISRIKNYETALEIEKEKLASVTGSAYLAKLQQFINRNSPYIAAENFYNGTYPTRGVLVDYTNMQYSYMVPLNKNNYYDKNFEKIESNQDLKDFHNLMMDVIEKIQENLTPELQSKLSTTSLPQLQKPLMEIFADPHLTLKAKMSAAYGRFLEFIRSLYSINPQSSVDNNLVDLITGKRLDQVNSTFLKGAKAEIERKTTFAIDTFKRAAGISLANKNKLEYSWNSLNVVDMNALEEILHPKQIIEMKNSPQQKFDIAKAIKDSVTNNVISDGSFDLPKIAKLFTTLTMEFSARNKVLPSLKLMMEHYKLIRNPNTSQQGNKLINKITGKASVKGERHNAINQIENWFNRVALGNFAKENEFGMTKSTERDTLNKEEKELKKKYEAIIKDLEDEIDGTTDSNTKSKLGKKKAYYESQIKLLGRKKSLSAFIDANFAFIRALGLGWNVSSQVTNLIEGQISNTTLGASGTYYSPQNLERANNIVLGSILKNATFGKLTTPGAKKASTIMHKFDVMQDATNELQKASNKNPLDNVNKIFAPFALISKVEYLNQTPVVIAILMDQKITDINGNESNVWDAMNPDGTLRTEFKTTENVENWENANGEAYKKFTATVGQAISFQHGDYSKIRGMKASEDVLGKTILMFKRWATMWLQSRLAQPHVSLRGKDYVLQKGRLRSHTKTTGAITGGIYGATVMSGAFTALGVALPALLPVAGGAILGGYLAQKFGMNANNKGIYKQVLGVDTVLKETALTMKLIALKMVGIPLNLMTGRQVIEHNKMFDGDKNANLAVDARNFRTNVSEIAIQLSLLGMAAIVRSMWGDDPEDEKKYNLMSNRIGKLLKQTNMIFDITDMHSLMTDFAVIRYTQNILKFLQEFGKVFGTEDLEVMKSGPHKGELKVVKTFKSAFLPSLLRDKDPLTFGFGTDMDKFYDFNTIAIVGKSKHGTEEEKAQEELSKIKKQLKKDYIENVDGLSTDEKKLREKMINKLLSKPSGGSYKTVLDNAQQYLDALSASYGEDGDPSLMEDAPSRKEVEEQFNMEGDIYPDKSEEEDNSEEENNSGEEKTDTEGE